MRSIILILTAVTAMLVTGCAGFKDGVKNAANKGVDVAVTVAKAPISLLDIATPVVQDPAQPDNPAAQVVNPKLVEGAQAAATTFGGPYGVPIAAAIGVLAGLVPLFLRKKATTPPPPTVLSSSK